MTHILFCESQVKLREQHAFRRAWLYAMLATVPATVALTLIIEDRIAARHEAQIITIKPSGEYEVATESEYRERHGYPRTGTVQCVIGRGTHEPPIPVALPPEHPKAQAVVALFPMPDLREPLPEVQVTPMGDTP